MHFELFFGDFKRGEGKNFEAYPEDLLRNFYRVAVEIHKKEPKLAFHNSRYYR
jgi:hypothetical protein